MQPSNTQAQARTSTNPFSCIRQAFRRFFRAFCPSNTNHQPETNYTARVRDQDKDQQSNDQIKSRFFSAISNYYAVKDESALLHSPRPKMQHSAHDRVYPRVENNYEQASEADEELATSPSTSAQADQTSQHTTESLENQDRDDLYLATYVVLTGEEESETSDELNPQENDIIDQNQQTNEQTEASVKTPPDIDIESNGALSFFARIDAGLGRPQPAQSADEDETTESPTTRTSQAIRFQPAESPDCDDEYAALSPEAFLTLFNQNMQFIRLNMTFEQSMLVNLNTISSQDLGAKISKEKRAEIMKMVFDAKKALSQNKHNAKLKLSKLSLMLFKISQGL